jgi:hypothetical protein
LIAIAIVVLAPIAAIAQSFCPLAGHSVTPQQVADALQNAPNLNQGLKSCSMAAMAMQESSGNTCANNSCCVGVLQLNFGSSGVLSVPGYGDVTKASYANMSLQDQVNIWSSTANSNASGSGYQTLLSAYNSGQGVGGHAVTPGMLAACEQFGTGVCNRNVGALQSTGSCGGAADGNGQTVCSWGASADKQAANQNCQMGNCSIDNVGDFPTGPAPQPATETYTS